MSTPVLPDIGETILIPFMGRDRQTKISHIPENQPLLSDGIVLVIDNDDDFISIEWESGTWVLVPPTGLTSRQSEILDKQTLMECGHQMAMAA